MVMGKKNDRLRIRLFNILGKEIQVNTNPRKGVAFRAAFRGEAGKWGDSEHSWQEAVGNLLLNWGQDK